MTTYPSSRLQHLTASGLHHSLRGTRVPFANPHMQERDSKMKVTLLRGAPKVLTTSAPGGGLMYTVRQSRHTPGEV